VAPNRPRRNPNSDVQQQFIGDALLAPGWIVDGHFGDQFLQGGGNMRPVTRPRFPFPKETESLAMPADQSIRFDDGEAIVPVKETGQSGQRKPNRVCGPPRFCFSRDIKSESFA
jgi:hypothetical protein